MVHYAPVSELLRLSPVDLHALAAADWEGGDLASKELGLNAEQDELLDTVECLLHAAFLLFLGYLNVRH